MSLNVSRVLRLVRKYKVWLIMYAVLAVFFWLTPRTVDDYTYYVSFQYIESWRDFWAVNEFIYNRTNGRVVGNLLSVMLSHSRVLYALFAAAVLVSIYALLKRLAKPESPASKVILLSLFVFLPVHILQQTYAWRSGFFNYVMPVLILLAVIYLFLRMLGATRQPVVNPAKNFTVMLLLTFVGSLFVENVTLGLVASSVAAVIWALLVKNKQALAGAIGAATGSLLGTWVMFSAPAYKRVTSGEDVHRDIPSGVSSLLETVQENAFKITDYLLGKSLLLVVVLAAAIALAYLGVLGYGKVRKITLRSKMQTYIAGVLVLISVVSAGCLLLLGKLAELVGLEGAQAESASSWVYVAAFVGLVLAFGGVIITIKDQVVRRPVVTLYLMALLFLAPLLVVEPISPRVLYPSYILLMLSGFMTIKYQLSPAWARLSSARQKKLWWVALTVLIAGVVMVMAVYSAIAARERSNEAEAERQISLGYQEIMLERYPCEEYVHHAWYNTTWPSLYFSKCKCLYRFHCECERDITVKYRGINYD